MTVTKSKSDKQIRHEAIFWVVACISIIGAVIGLGVLTRGWFVLALVVGGMLYWAYKIAEQIIRDNDDPDYREGL